MNTWTDAAAVELEVELKRLDLDAEAKRVSAEQAQTAYDAVLAEQATVRQMLEWTHGRQARQAEEPALTDLDSPQAEPAPPTHSELCIHALTQIGRAATTAQVRHKIAQAGHTLSQDQVRSALKYLAGKKKNSPVEAVRPGVFRLRRPSGGYVLPAPIPAVVPAANGTGGSP